MSKVYYVRVEDHELYGIEQAIRKHVIETVAGEIREHSKALAVDLLQGKPLTKKKWYETLDGTELDNTKGETL